MTQQLSAAAVSFAVVAIGRNEGERLARCLRSALRATPHVVYVDSGSSDGSVELAQSLGSRVLVLDHDVPFTAARARNAGFRRLMQEWPTVERVQFVDGDCEFSPGWLQKADRFLRSHPQAAVVCGRRRERHPEHSLYNRLCDAEWNTPVGQALACGGDAMMRCEALLQVGGYRDDLIAGEEPELCVRLRRQGWQVWRLNAEMTLHDAAMTRFGQWWRRTRRAGHAFAEGAALHGAPPERHWVRESRSAWAWGLGLPLLALGATALAGLWGLLPLAAYPLQVLRLGLRSTDAPPLKWARPLFLVLGKFPEALGQLQFWRNRLMRRRAGLIEYK